MGFNFCEGGDVDAIVASELREAGSCFLKSRFNVRPIPVRRCLDAFFHLVESIFDLSHANIGISKTKYGLFVKGVSR